MNRCIAIIFLLIFSFQVLPVKELGKMLFKGQMTEEVHAGCDIEGDDCPVSKIKKESEYIKIFHVSEASVALQTYISAKILTAIHKTESLPSHFVPDITTPPPNC